MTYRIRTILVAIGLALAAMLLTLLYVTNVRRSAHVRPTFRPRASAQMSSPIA